ncbi:DEKNAAC105377 [Brettanomyces naardenensis]|uniref:DEKNAAC105377 n=1 Tax=Brettanomyces naardenensis TaxID=13370 RepID=A0A448YTB6_BRENA|nr:DEKNAAC105377 [Brettanomyces naardenensis]
MSLSSVKLAILGNDKEKLKLCSDPAFLPRIVSLLSDSTPDVLKDCVIILQAFTRLDRYYPVEFPPTLQITTQLVDSARRYPVELTSYSLAALSELLSAGTLPSIDASDDLISLLRHVLRNRNASSDEVRDACAVIVRTRTVTSAQLIALYRPLLRRIAYVTAPLFARALSDNNLDSPERFFTDFSSSRTSPVPPATPLPGREVDVAARELVPLLQALANLLPRVREQASHTVVLPPPLHYTLCALLRSLHSGLRMAAATVLTQYTKSHVTDQAEREATYHKVLPVLLALANEGRKATTSTTGKIDASTTTSLNPTGESALRAASPLHASPMRVLAEVAQDYPPARVALVGVKFADRAAAAVTEGFTPYKKFLSTAAVHRVSDALLVLSCVCSVEDAHRDMVAQYDLQEPLCRPLERHASLCKGLAAKDQLSTRELRALRLSSELTLSTCYLMRAMSRSASMLRTFLIDLDPVELLVNLSCAPIVNITGIDDDLAEREVVLRSVVLGIMANLVVEFSAVRERFFQIDLYNLLRRYIEPKGESSSVSASSTLLRVSALQVIRNSLYSDDSVFKQQFTSGSALDLIFELCEDPSDKVQQQCFNILRNISVTSLAHSARLYDSYAISSARSKTGDKDFLEFLRRHLESAQNPETTTAINYILVHFASSTLQSKLLLTQNESLLKKLLELLKEPIPEGASEDEDDKYWKVKLSIVWIVTNLTWREETSASDTEDSDAESNEEGAMDIDQSSADYTKTRNRARKLIDLGFYDEIKTLSSNCRIADFKERARTAIFQLVFHDDSRH